MFYNFKLSKSFIAVIFLFLFSVMSCIAYSIAAPTSAKADPSSVKRLSLPVVMYHSLLKDEKLQGDYVISPELFQSDIRYLKENGYRIIGVQELLDYSECKLDLPDKCVMLTFDDGYYNNYLYAYPIAREENVKFVLSPIGINSEIQTEGEHLSPSYSHCTWSQLRDMVGSGCVELMNHSYDMHKNTSRKGTKIMSGEDADSYKSALTADLSKAQGLFKNEVGVTPIGFTYPFGAVCDEAEQIIRELGFRLSFTCEEKTNTIEAGNPDSLYGIGRYLRNNKESSKDYFERILTE